SAGVAESGLHLPERAPRQALRHSACAGQPVSESGAGAGEPTGRVAPPWKHFGGDLVRDADFAGDPGRLDFKKHHWNAHASSAGGYSGADGEYGERKTFR